MPSPERGGHQPEREPTLYYQAARFGGEEPAGQAYFRAQEAVFKAPECDLSVYRLQLNQIWHVAVLGDPPPEILDARLRTILSTGEYVSLEPFIVKVLQTRRDAATKQGDWVEGHYWPGKRL